MNFKNLSIAALLLAASVWLVYSLTDWFRAPRIQIVAQVRPLRIPSAQPVPLPVSFTLDADYKLTRIKVLRLQGSDLSPVSQPVWHLIASSPKDAVRGFLFGVGVPGMTNSPDCPKAGSLEPGTTYRIFVEAGRYQGVADFQSRLSGDSP